MKHAWCVLIVAATGMLGCTSGESDLAEQQKLDAHIASMKKIPAREWLSTNRNESALATNRFGATANAKAFVEDLFLLGAEAVFVGDPMEEQYRIEKEGGPYADTLVVQLPDDLNKRRALFKVFSAEARREGFDSPNDIGQKQALLWWD